MADKAKPRKKPFLTVGVPGARRTLGGGTTGGASAVAQPNLLGALQTKTPVAKATSGPVTTKEIPLGNAPPGRPPTNLGNYLIKPTDTTISGFEMLNETPDLLDSVHKKFMEKFELPTHLRPSRFLSPEIEHTRAMNISRGWRAPRSRAR